MAESIVINGKQAIRGANITISTGFRLVQTQGVKRYWVGSLIASEKVGDEQIIVFKVRKAQAPKKRAKKRRTT